MLQFDQTLNTKRRFLDALLDLLEEKSAPSVERYLAASQALDNRRNAVPTDPTPTAQVERPRKS